jgi:hypothetical protein
MVAARLANVVRGEIGAYHEKTEGQITTSDAAELLNVSRATVNEAKTVLTRGTPEEISAVERGEAAVGDSRAANTGKYARRKTLKERTPFAGKSIKFGAFIIPRGNSFEAPSRTT